METSRKQRMCLAFVNGIQDTHAESNTHTHKHIQTDTNQTDYRCNDQSLITIFKSKQTNNY